MSKIHWFSSPKKRDCLKAFSSPTPGGPTRKIGAGRPPKEERIHQGVSWPAEPQDIYTRSQKRREKKLTKRSPDPKGKKELGASCQERGEGYTTTSRLQTTLKKDISKWPVLSASKFSSPCQARKKQGKGSWDTDKSYKNKENIDAISY